MSAVRSLTPAYFAMRRVRSAIINNGAIPMSMIKKTLICASLTLFCATASAATSLKIGTEGGYPPWSMVDAKGTVTGFDADVGAALCAALNADCAFVVQAFDSLIP